MKLGIDFHGWGFLDPGNPGRGVSLYVGKLPNRKYPALYVELKFPPGPCEECGTQGWAWATDRTGTQYKKTCFACFGVGRFPRGSTRLLPLAFFDSEEKTMQTLAIMDFLTEAATKGADRARFATLYERLAGADGRRI